MVDGRVVKTTTGENTDAMRWVTWDVRASKGKPARIVIKDAVSGGWGHIDVDQIEFSNTPRQTDQLLHKEADFGALALALLDDRWTTIRRSWSIWT
jgi:hypothetical protein